VFNIQKRITNQKKIANRTRLVLLLGLIAAMGMPLAAQSLDHSANNLLQGTYYFREVIYLVGDAAGDLNRALSAYGNITFSGTGTYTIAATVVDSSASSLQQLNGSTGTYGVAPSGFAWISSPVSTGDVIYGLVANGIFVGSSTESGFNDMLVAAAIGSSPATAATFVGSYAVAGMDFPDGTIANDQGNYYQLNADGKGNLGTVAANTYTTYGTTVYSQNIPSVKYVASNGAIAITFAPQTVSGLIVPNNQYLYISPDGNFIFGGNPYGWDMFVGVRMGSSTAVPNFGGLYYQAGIDENINPNAGAGTLDTYYGSLSASQGSIWDHQRTAIFETTSILSAGEVHFDDTFNDGYTVGAGGGYDDPNVQFHYTVGSTGAIRIGYSRGPLLGINVAIQAPTFSSPAGPYIFPDGIVNSASGAPFTAPVSRGEEVTLNGSDLARSPAGQSVTPHTTQLNGVQVLANGVPAEIDYVSPGQIYFQVPWETTQNLVQIQVVNQDGSSNTVTLFVALDAPGVYTIPSGGIGYAAALDASNSYTLISPANPAQIGDEAVIYIDGFGDVSPAVADGAVAGPMSATVNNFQMAIGGVAVPTPFNFIGLVPGTAGLYEIDFTIPAGVPSGDQIVNISSPDAVTSEALISIAPAIASASAASPQAVRKTARHGLPLPQPSGRAAARSPILP